MNSPHPFRILGKLALSFLLLGPIAANAATISYNLSYSGVAFGNSAIGSGVISFDDSILPNGPISLLNVSPTSLGIVGFTITISGSNSGNGAFGLTDFSAYPNGWIWSLTAPINLGAELVGQAGFLDFNWCAGTPSCGNPLAPGGTSPFLITTSGETRDTLALISMAPAAVPVPAAFWFLGSALSGLLGISVRKKYR